MAQTQMIETSSPSNLDVLRTISEGATALVSTKWLEEVLSRYQVQSNGFASTLKREVKTPTFDRAGRGLWKWMGKANQDIRGRKTLQRVATCLKKHKSGICPKEMMEELGMPSSTLHYALKKLKDRHVARSLVREKE